MENVRKKRLFGRYRSRWEKRIGMDLKETGCDSVDWINLAQDGDQRRFLVIMAMNTRVP